MVWRPEDASHAVRSSSVMPNADVDYIDWFNSNRGLFYGP